MIWLAVGIALVVGGLFGIALTIMLVLINSDHDEISLDDNSH